MSGDRFAYPQIQNGRGLRGRDTEHDDRLCRLEVGIRSAEIRRDELTLTSGAPIQIFNAEFSERCARTNASSLSKRPPPIAPIAEELCPSRASFSFAAHSAICVVPRDLRERLAHPQQGRREAFRGGQEADIIPPAIAQPSVRVRVVLRDRHRAKNVPMPFVDPHRTSDAALRTRRGGAVKIPGRLLKRYVFEVRRPTGHNSVTLPEKFETYGSPVAVAITS